MQQKMRGTSPRPTKARRSNRLGNAGKIPDFDEAEDGLAIIMRSIPMPEVMKLIWNRLGESES